MHTLIAGKDGSAYSPNNTDYIKYPSSPTLVSKLQLDSTDVLLGEHTFQADGHLIEKEILVLYCNLISQKLSAVQKPHLEIMFLMVYSLFVEV